MYKYTILSLQAQKNRLLSMEGGFKQTIQLLAQDSSIKIYGISKLRNILLW